MTTDTEVDMRDVELNEVDPEKQPMTSGDTGNGEATSPVTEKNGTVKVKIPDEKEVKFTGLSKEELLRVAGTPGWVRTRWVLLILFWLGWLGMLAGAIAIIVQAPRCKPLPEMNWWDDGPLYQIGDVKSFAGDSGIAGLEKTLEHVGKLKMKGLIIGPIHSSSPNVPEDLNLQEISSDTGNMDQLKKFIDAAHKKSISVVLDLTPNYKGSDLWFSSDRHTEITKKVLDATDFWLKKDLDGILLHDVQRFETMDLFWTELRDMIKNHTQEEKKKVLIGVAKTTSADDVSRLLNKTGVDLILSEVLTVQGQSGMEISQIVDHLYSAQDIRLGWNIGERIRGHLASIVKSAQVKLSQMLLLTLPGTAVFNYGDEIGLKDEQANKSPMMVWKDSMNVSETEKELMTSFKSVFEALSDYRTKQRSLQHGEYLPLHNSTTAMAYLRKWDQSERYIVALNWHDSESITLNLAHREIPEKATVVVSTDTKQLAVDTTVDLAQLVVGPEQAVMLKFPYTP